MKKLVTILILLVLISGCELTIEKILEDPELVSKKCNKLETTEEKNSCFTTNAEMLANTNSEISLQICNNLENTLKDKCIFQVFSALERKNKIDEAVNICKNIQKEGFAEWCETRKNQTSITIAPSLE